MRYFRAKQGQRVMVPLHERIAQAAVPLYLEHNLTSEQVGRRLYVSGTTVRRALKHMDVPLRPSGRHGRTYLQPIDLHRAKHLYETKGLTLDGVAAHLGISRNTARNRLLKAGVEMRTKGGKPRA